MFKTPQQDFSPQQDFTPQQDSKPVQPFKTHRFRPRHTKFGALSAAVVVGALGTYYITQSSAATTGGSGGLYTNATNVSYTANGVTSKYHLYAAGLDWTKPVGMLIYADGSAEYGLKNPSSNYLLAGTDGLVNVAKRNNMVLVTPFAPGGGCPDGDGTCWYQASGGYSRLQKTQWAEALVKNVQTRYPIELNRVAMGGYSSGAQLASQAWVPSGAAQRTMTDGVIVSISCGGPPAVTEVTYSEVFKSNIHMNWNSGTNDRECPHTATWSTAGGYNHYTNKGFQTSRDLISGVTHNRDRQFGKIMEAQIKEHVPAAIGTVSPPATAPSPPPATTPTTPPATPPNTTTGSGGAQTDQTNLSYTANSITSKYHLYAASLDWSKSVGLMIYGDGSGEFGLKNPSSTYLLAGTNGLINVAKRNNMVLVTPLAPGTGCPDGAGTCWYEPSSGFSTTQKVQWAEALVKYVQSRYPINLNRVAMGGFSSGAQLATQYWTASGAAQRTMNDGVIVAISCGGAPSAVDYPTMAEVAYTAAFKANVHINWNIGDRDNECPHTATWSANGGYNHYTSKGFQTSKDLLSGVTHVRDGQFGQIMEAQIKEHVTP